MESSVSTTNSKVCLRCNKTRDTDYEYHLCPDLKGNDAYNPFRMEIDLTNISDKLEYCQQIENILENITVHLEADPKALKEVLLLRNRVHAIVERLIKLYALHAPYRLNEWDNIISHLEENCEALEKRIIGK